MFATRFDDMASAEHIGRKILTVWPPNAGFGGDVKNNIATGDRPRDRIRISEVTLELLDAEGVQFGIYLA